MNNLFSYHEQAMSVIPYLFPVAGLLLGLWCRQRESRWLRGEMGAEKQRISFGQARMPAVESSLCE
jgi:hypothetical protein